MSLSIQFLGAAKTVTGSKYLVTGKNTRILIDCGLFQGLKALRSQNWLDLPVSPDEIDWVFLTHAHIDHSGWIPRFVKQGYSGIIYATQPTIDLCGLLLPDSGYLQEEDARFANRKGYSKHKPALPLYTYEEAEHSLKFFKPIDFHEVKHCGDFKVEYYGAGHMLSAASILLTHKPDGKRVLFSGDLGRSHDLIIPKPERPPAADYVVLESTYGNRVHEAVHPIKALQGVLEKVQKRNGILMIPAFAVGRTQLILHCLYEIFQDHPELQIPVYVNSPMATSASKIYYIFNEDHRLSEDHTKKMMKMANWVYDVNESKQLNLRKGPMVIVAASGMLTGGRILHHIKAFAGDDRNAILLAGFQSAGTRGEALQRGKKTLRIHGEEISILCEVIDFKMLSGHADQNELTSWVKSLPERPKKVFLTHGEEDSMNDFKEHLEKNHQLSVVVPDMGQDIQLGR